MEMALVMAFTLVMVNQPWLIEAVAAAVDLERGMAVMVAQVLLYFVILLILTNGANG